jgi:hypothetical protein
MAETRTLVAVLGRFLLIPGIQRCQVRDRELLVGHDWAPKIVDEAHSLEVDTSDCTVFKVRHLGASSDELSIDILTQLLDDSLEAISEILVWERAHEIARRVSPFSRQVGRVDVKLFAVDGPQGARAIWLSPVYENTADSLHGMGAFLGNMVISNGVAANPLPSEIRRVMAAIDLLNLGFFSEAFLTCFSLCDDLVQRVVAAGMASRGLAPADQKAMLRVINENRLHIFATQLMKLCGWVGLDEHDSSLLKSLDRVNRLRNQIMHGSLRMTRNDAI